MKKLLLFVIGIAVLNKVFSQTTITVNPSVTYQTIRGFGGAGTMESGYDNYLRYMVDLMGLTAFRIFVEDGESRGTSITVDEINNGTFNFTYGDKYANFFKALKAKGVTMIIANFGSPPASLKKNNCVCQKWGGTCCSSPCGTYNCPDADNYLLPEYYDEDAKYKANWVKHFEEKTTCSLYGLGIQNEPLFNEPYASAILEADKYGQSLLENRNALNSLGLNHVKLYGPEHMGSFSRNSGGDGTRSRYIQNLLWNPTNRAALDAYAVHSYTDGIAYDLGSAASWTSMDTAVRKWNKDLWMSETEFGGDYNWKLYYDMISAQFAALKYGKVNAWLYWSLKNGMFPSNGPTPRLYACMHFFRFIRPGYQQVECTESDPDVAAIAFKNGNDYTIVAVNMSTKNAKTITFNDFTGKPGYFDMYRSMNRNATELEKCAFAGRITNNTFELPTQSVATLYFKESEPNVYWGVNAPTNLVASDIKDNSFKVNWTAAAPWTLAGSPVNVTGYTVYLNGTKKTPSGPITTTNYTFTGLTKGTKYVVEIYTRDAMYNESVAARIEVNTTCSTNDCVDPIGIYEKENLKILLSPNPASDCATIELPDENLYNISFVNISGITAMATQARNEDRINIAALPKGLYVVIAQNNQYALTTKIIIE